jgi:ribonuclease P protein component
LRYVVYAENADETSAEILFSTPKKFLKRANKRNKIRRRMREAYRLNKQILASGEPRLLQVALIYSSKEMLNYKTIENATKRILENLCE